MKNHKYGVMQCIAKREKIYVYVIPNCANCVSGYETTVFGYLTKQKA